MIYTENCLDTMAKMADETIDLVVTSPPYDNLRTYNGYSFEFESVAKELFRITKQGGVVVWVVGDATIKGSETGTSFRQALYFKEVGFNLHDTMIYAKNNPIPLTHNRYEQQFEYMFVFAKNKPKSFNPIMKSNKYSGGSTGKYYQSATDNETSPANTKKPIRNNSIENNIWYFSVGKSGINHPAVFPEQLANDHIITWSNGGDLVYDPFMGSGTTAIAAIKNNRDWIGSEISDKYVAIANDRIALIKGQNK